MSLYIEKTWSAARCRWCWSTAGRCTAACSRRWSRPWPSAARCTWSTCPATAIRATAACRWTRARSPRRLPQHTPPAIWLGWSMGGLVALAAARDAGHPDARRWRCFAPRRNSCAMPAGRKAATAPWCTSSPPTWKPTTTPRWSVSSRWRRWAAPIRGPSCAACASRCFHAANRICACCRKASRCWNTPTGATRCATLDCPTAWIAGRRDRLVHPDAMRWSAAQAQGDFHEIAHAGHAPFLGHVDAVVDALLPLLEQAR